MKIEWHHRSQQSILRMSKKVLQWLAFSFTCTNAAPSILTRKALSEVALNYTPLRWSLLAT
jgi:hypothetical protein